MFIFQIDLDTTEDSAKCTEDEETEGDKSIQSMYLWHVIKKVCVMFS